uniref:Endonuclease/exonuclease/phosphatase domain-containing protein n=1 Tax=Glossina austeni TaxID=7395 RepID=A0A1A9V5Y9_GLOAU
MKVNKNTFDCIGKLMVNLLAFKRKPKKLEQISKACNCKTYASIVDNDAEENETFYSELIETRKPTKKSNLNLIMGDFNAKVEIVGTFGLGLRNERDDRFDRFLKHSFKICNIFFQLSPRRSYTYSQHVIRNQEDCILMNKTLEHLSKESVPSQGQMYLQIIIL